MADNNLNKYFYATTPIYFCNSNLHIWYHYATIVIVTIDRYKKLLGYKVKFLTGTDKHGEAEKNNLMPMDYVNSTVESTKKLWAL